MNIKFKSVLKGAVIILIIPFSLILEDSIRNLKLNLQERIDSYRTITNNNIEKKIDLDKEWKCNFLKNERFKEYSFRNNFMEECRKVVLEIYIKCNNKKFNPYNKGKDLNAWNNAWNVCALDKLKNIEKQAG